jgi:predicted ATP-dependent protease
VNQRGQIQAIGGVNEKIEGYFDTCRAIGLTGSQGVIIPAANIKHLMLREDVVEEIRDGRFHIYAVSSVDEGFELLTGRTAGEMQAGRYPEGTFNQLVQERLEELAQKGKSFAHPPPKTGGAELEEASTVHSARKTSEDCGGLVNSSAFGPASK